MTATEPAVAVPDRVLDRLNASTDHLPRIAPAPPMTPDEVLNDPRYDSPPASAHPAPEVNSEAIAADLETRLATLPAEFWTARPWLTQVRDAAWSRQRSPDFTLHATLARLAAYSDHRLELPAIVGSVGSLNFFSAGIGPPGTGKSNCSKISGELVDPPAGLDVADEKPLGSGEGLAELYMGTVEEKDENGKKQRIRKQVRHNAYVYVDEGEELTKLGQRQGSTIHGALRRAWAGQTLGQSNASTDRTRVVPADAYRLGLVADFQMTNAAELLTGATAGTPQRFLFASVITSLPDVTPPWPGPLKLPRPHPSDVKAHEHPGRSGYTRVTFGVDDEIADEIRATDRARVQGETTVDTLDAHAPLHRLKIAALLALADGRLDITVDDWHLSSIVWATSRRVRDTIVTAARAAEERTEAARTERHAARELAAEASRQSAAATVEVYATRLARWVHAHAHEQPDDGWPRKTMRGRFTTTERPLLKAVLNHAISNGWITDTDGRYSAGKAEPPT